MNKYYIIIVSLFIISCNDNGVEKENLLSEESKTCNCYSSSPIDGYEVTFSGQVPGDINQFNTQSKADCFAWQSFIALNWPVDSSKTFGEPGDLSFVQWETYMPKDILFNEDGTKPPAWGTLVSDRYADKFKSQKLLMNNTQTKLLTFTSKVSDEESIDHLDFHQAAPFGQPNWLGAQNSTNVWYEIMLNKDFYDFVVEKGYYNAKTQHDSIRNGVAMKFPE